MLAHCTETVSGNTRGGRNKCVSITCRECGRTKFMAPIKMEAMPKTKKGDGEGPGDVGILGEMAYQQHSQSEADVVG